MEPDKMQFRIAARILLLNNDNQLLLVANSEKLSWFTPGGRVEADESLEEAVIRETYEETGLTIKNPKLIYVREAMDHNHEKKYHHVCFYFFARTEESLPETWEDHDGYVDLNKFFSREELQKEEKVWPDILRDTFWEDLKDDFANAQRYGKYTITY